MNRRNFLLLSIISITASFVLKSAASVKVYVVEGKLGYKLNGKKGRQCSQCKHFNTQEEDGECKLPTMQTVMKSKQVFVKQQATCNMWVQK